MGLGEERVTVCYRLIGWVWTLIDVYEIESVAIFYIS